MARWWSESRRAWKDVEKMHDMELLNSYRKLDRGDYRDESGLSLSVDEWVKLHEAFLAELKRRGLDPIFKTGHEEPPPAEA